MLHYKAVFITETGKRPRNNDALSVFSETQVEYPTGQVFVLCDGSGKLADAGKAAQLASREFAMLMGQYKNGLQTKEQLENALKEVEIRFSEQEQSDPFSTFNGSTTLAYLAVNNYGAFLAWVGDSPVYHIRSNKILFQSEPHTLFSKLIAQDGMTITEAEKYPGKHMLTNVIKGEEEPAFISFEHIRDIEIGDYLLLCSDGILEAITPQGLTGLIAKLKDIELVKKELAQICKQKSEDNYSMILVQVSL